MATYKLIQDIEAEDHILGPLTLRQFIYSLATAFLFYLCFLVLSKHLPYLLFIFLPPALFAGFLAFPFKRDQPTEVWALAKVRYMTKPKKRIWSQSGIKNLVTITAPKKTEKPLTNGLSQNEVKNRLQSLATMIDSRGWAVKNMGDVPSGGLIEPDDTDRLITPGSLPAPVADIVDDDIFSDQSPQSQHMNEVINQHTQEARQHLLSIMEQGNTKVSSPVSESTLSSDLKLRAQQSNLSTSGLHAIGFSKPKATQTTKKSEPPKESQKQTATHIDPSVLSFALNNSGLSVQTLANEANKPNTDNEVVINLH